MPDEQLILGSGIDMYGKHFEISKPVEGDVSVGGLVPVCLRIFICPRLVCIHEMQRNFTDCSGNLYRTHLR